MGQLKVVPPTKILSLTEARFLKAEADCYVRAKSPNHLSGAAELAPPTTTERLGGKPETKNHSRSAELLTVARIPRSSSSASQSDSAANQQLADQTPPTPSLINLTAGTTRTLIAVLILALLLPNLTLGSIFWLGVFNTPWSRPVMLPPDKSSVPAVKSAIPPPVLSAPAKLEATAGEDVTFPIALDGTDGVPARSIIAISGLPQGSMLSSGRPYGETEWNLKTDEIGDLRLVLPPTASGESKLTIKLITPDSTVIADTETVLNVAANPEGYSERAAETGSGDAAMVFGANQEPVPAVKPDLTEARAQAPGATSAELADVEAAKGTPADPVQSRRSSPAVDDVHANWIEPVAFVNLREGPSPSAPVVTVVAKGTKLRVIGRKDRWVQVTNPTSSEKGWIYTGHVATVTKARPRGAVSRAE
jgi:hypothetical protein